jgi:hypothetical protein
MATHLLNGTGYRMRLSRLAVGFAALASLCACLYLGAPAQANAGQFCWGVELSPDQQPASQDHCDATWGGPLYYLRVKGNPYNVCGNTTDVNGGLNDTWFCTQGANNWEVRFWPKDGWYRRAKIWNISHGWNHAWGEYACYCS